MSNFRESLESPDPNAQLTWIHTQPWLLLVVRLAMCSQKKIRFYTSSDNISRLDWPSLSPPNHQKKNEVQHLLIEGHVHIHRRLQQFCLHGIVTQDVHRQRFNQLTRHSDQPGDVHLVSDKALAIETRAVEDPKPWTMLAMLKNLLEITQLIQYSLYVVGSSYLFQF